MTERLQKAMARHGLGSRRALEELIRAGRVLLNGKAAQIGQKIDLPCVVTVDGREIRLAPQQGCRVIMYHKPEGEITTRDDPQMRPTVFERLPALREGRWLYVGRLDFNTSGLLLFTNDGALANALTHPRSGIERVYAVRVYGEVTPQMMEKLRVGVELEDGPARFTAIDEAGGEGRNAWFHVTLTEGRKREVRRMWEAVGVKVSRLIRISFAGLKLDPSLKAGQWRYLELSEVNALRRLGGLEELESLGSLDALPPGAGGPAPGWARSKAQNLAPPLGAFPKDPDGGSRRGGPYGGREGREGGSGRRFGSNGSRGARPDKFRQQGSGRGVSRSRHQGGRNGGDGPWGGRGGR